MMRLKPLRGAVFSECRRYRYVLWRIWNQEMLPMAVIGLNPSTADEVDNDPTVTRCINYAKDWGFGGLYMLNAFALKSTDPKKMKKAIEPVGKLNDRYIRRYVKRAAMTLLAWGNDGIHLERADGILENLQGIELHCLGTTGSGQPRHPLYLARNLRPILWKGVR